MNNEEQSYSFLCKYHTQNIKKFCDVGEYSNHIHATLNIKSKNYNGFVNIIIHKKSEFINSVIISIPTEFDGVGMIALKKHVPTFIFFDNDDKEDVYKTWMKYYKNPTIKKIEMTKQYWCLIFHTLEKFMEHEYLGENNITKNITLELTDELDLKTSDIYYIPNGVTCFFNGTKYEYINECVKGRMSFF